MFSFHLYVNYVNYLFLLSLTESNQRLCCFKFIVSYINWSNWRSIVYATPMPWVKLSSSSGLLMYWVTGLKVNISMSTLSPLPPLCDLSRAIKGSTFSSSSSIIVGLSPKGSVLSLAASFLTLLLIHCYCLLNTW